MSNVVETVHDDGFEQPRTEQTVHGGGWEHRILALEDLVVLEIDDVGLVDTLHPTQARELARALLDAADAADARRGDGTTTG